ncbi:MAG TPA: carboxypeptidase regulatory-like domain-containing protein [Thermoanaerobaculia bacterium]|nr:carboxypeptidase regulatory-like domain-containing protein [Thermoanaerobaculia bacterium]
MRVRFVPLLFVAVAALYGAGQKSTLCIAGAPCLSVAGHGADVTPADTDRPFTWTEAQGKTTIGIVPAGAGHVSLEAPATIRLRLKSAAQDRWPARMTLNIRDKQNHSWSLDLPARQGLSGLELRAPGGQYDVEVIADRHRREMRHVTFAASPTELSVVLKPLPQIAGRVVSTSGEAIAGADLRVNEHAVAVSDVAGRFSFDADPENWPEAVSIRAGGYGTRMLPIPRARIDTDLLDVVLGAGGSLRVSVERPPEIRSLRLALSKIGDGRRIQIDTRVMDSSSTIFENIEAGSYLLLVSGEKPEERLGVPVTVKAAEDKPVKISVRPRNLTIRAEMAGVPLGGARIRFFSRDGQWDGEFTAAESGELQLFPWQLGKVTAWVFKEGTLTVPHVEDHRFDDDDVDAQWTIHVSTREVRGRVLDAASGEAIVGANVALQVKGSNSYAAITKTGSDGLFVFTAAKPGHHNLHAAADGYQNGHASYEFLESEETHEVTMSLERSSSLRLFVQDASGRPIQDAAVLDYAGDTVTGQRFTDENGQVAIPLGRNELRRAFVIPRDGSFAVATIGGQPEATISVPVPQSTIVIRSRSTEQNPIDRVQFVIRYNGIPIPLEVQAMLARQQGAIIVSGSDGRIILPHVPIGVYEFWPVGSPAEARAAMIGLGKEAPITISATPGVNEAVLSFAPQKHP